MTEVKAQVGHWAIIDRDYGNYGLGKIDKITAQKVQLSETVNCRAASVYQSDVVLACEDRAVAAFKIEQLKSAWAEKRRREIAARQWHNSRVAEIAEDSSQ